MPYAEVIGDPVAHRKSPLIHKFWLEKLGIEGDYRAVRLRPGELADYLDSAARRSRLARLQRHHAAEGSGLSAGRRRSGDAEDRRR